jgi:hypothetical protein
MILRKTPVWLKFSIMILENFHPKESMSKSEDFNLRKDTQREMFLAHAFKQYLQPKSDMSII